MAAKLLVLLLTLLLSLFGKVSQTLAEEITIFVSGNGSESVSAADVTITTTTTVDQVNTAEITNNIDINANTGGNTADNNTGGDTTISTGDITGEVDILNIGNVNAAGPSSNTTSTTDVSITDNGTGSTNTVTINLSNPFNLSQNNSAEIENNVNIDANTGGNSASGNTGGSANISTGDISFATNIINCLNFNFFGLANPSTNCFPPSGGPGQQPGPGPTDNPAAQAISQASSSSSSSSDSSSVPGGILGVSTLPITGFKNIYALAVLAAGFMMAGLVLIRRSYTLELALVKQSRRGRFYNKDTL